MNRRVIARPTVWGGLVLAICAVFSTAGACFNTSTTDPFANGAGGSIDADTLTQRAIAGLEFFSQRGCAACHCNDGAGGCNLDAPALSGATVSMVDGRLRGAQTVIPHPLKLADISDEDVTNVATFLQSLQSETPIEGESQITRGYNLYIRGGCIVCHLSSAQGVNQGGTGLPIAGTSPANIYSALSGQIPCHPLQRTVPAEIPADCLFGINTNETVQELTDSGAADADPERIMLSYFLSFIAPPPTTGVVEPCEGVPGEICTIAGNGVSGFTRDRIPADTTLLYSPLTLELTDWNSDGVLDLGLVDWNNHRIRIIHLDTTIDGVANMIESIAGTGKVTGADALNHPTHLQFDSTGALVMANWHNQNIYRYAKGLRDGTQRDQLAGLCDLVCQSDAMGPTSTGTSFISLPTSVAIHPDGRIFFSEGGCSRIRVLTPGTTKTTMFPRGCLNEINAYPDGTIETFAGHQGMNSYSGDGGPASAAIFNVDNTPLFPNFGIAFSKDEPPSKLYVCDSKNHCIRVIDMLADPPTIDLFAGVPGTIGYLDGPATSAMFNFPTFVHVADNGFVYIADTRNHAIRRIDPDGLTVTTIAGTGVKGFNGDNQPATSAQLNSPYGVAVHPDGRIFIADTDNNRVRVIHP